MESLDSFILESFETCKSCLLGKMTKIPFSIRGERVDNLLELIHIDVYEPMKKEARSEFL
jgi:hypothetical protein